MLKPRDYSFAFAGLTIALLIFAIVWSAPRPQLCPQQPQDGATAYQDNANNGPSPRSTGNPAANPTHSQCDERADSDWWTIRIGGITILVLLGQFIMFWRQLNAMRDGVQDASRAAIAATKQAKIAQDTFEALERPYVFVFGLSGIASLPDEGFIPRVRYNVANYGKVAAIINGVWIVISGVANGVPEIPVLVGLDHILMTSPVLAPGALRRKIVNDLPEGAIGIHDGPQFIGAQQGIGLEPNLNLNEDLLAKIIIRYRGPFTRHHITSIAWRWDKLTGGFVVIADPAHTFNR